jgi:WD40 repeat protein
MATGNERWGSAVTEWSKAIAFAPEGRFLAIGGRDGIVRMWDPANGTQVHELTGDDS